MGLSTKELAYCCDCSIQAIGQYERGERRPSYIIGKKLIDALGLSFEQVYGIGKAEYTGNVSIMNKQPLPARTALTDNAVRAMIMRIINEAMEKHDRYVTINFFDGGPFVTVYPLTDDDETDD